MKLEHWMQLLFGTVIIGGLAFLSVNLFDMKGILSSVSTKVEDTDKRLGRIADTLPEVKARIAWEEINTPISGFIATTLPQETDTNKWRSSVKVYDARTKQLLSYSVTLSNNDKYSLAYSIAGRVRAENEYGPTFAELVEYSKREREPVAIPNTVLTSTSFVLRKSDVEKYSEFLRDFTGKEPTIQNIGHVGNWKEVSVKLTELEKALAKWEYERLEKHKK